MREAQWFFVAWAAISLIVSLCHGYIYRQRNSTYYLFFGGMWAVVFVAILGGMLLAWDGVVVFAILFTGVLVLVENVDGVSRKIKDKWDGGRPIPGEESAKEAEENNKNLHE